MIEVVEGFNDPAALEARWQAFAPPAYRGAELSACDPQFSAWWEAVLARRVLNLIVLGPNRTGKTFGMMALAREMVFRQIDGRRVKMTELFDDLRSDRVGWDDLAGTSILLVDDLGAEHDSAWGRSIVLRLFDVRSEARRPTVVSTNLDPDGIRERYGEGVLQRLAEDSMKVVLDGAWWDR